MEYLVTGLSPKGSREKGELWLGDQLMHWDGYFQLDEPLAIRHPGKNSFTYKTTQSDT